MGKQHMTLYPQLGRKLKSRRSVLTVASTLSVLLTACGGGGGNSSPTVTVPTPLPVVTDSTAPVVTLLGFDNVEVVVDGLYFDPGATASDNQDGDISHQITLASAVNTAIAGAVSGTVCSLRPFMRSGGIVHTLAFRSISSHVMPRASPDRAAVSIKNRRQSVLTAIDLLM